MKYLKILGLAAVAALALMAFVGAGTASAETTLCKTTEDPCVEPNMYPIGTKIESTLKTGVEATLKAGCGTVKCKISKVVGETETTTTPAGPITSLTFEECNCKVTVIKPGRMTVHWDAEHNGSLTVSGFQVTVGGPGIKCFLIENFDCKYEGEVNAGLTVKGGNPAIMTATAAKIPQVGGTSGETICGKEGEWNAEYEVTAPKPLYVTKGL